MDTKPKKRNIAAFFLPTSAIKRSVTAIRHTSEVVGGSLKAQLPDQRVSKEYPPDDLRNISDSKARYRALYEANRWTPSEIQTQLKVIRATKMVAFVMAIVSVATIILVALFAPLWVLFFFIVGAGATMLIGVAKGFQYALYETQIQLEDLISAKEFTSRPDFFSRLIG